MQGRLNGVWRPVAAATLAGVVVVAAGQSPSPRMTVWDLASLLLTMEHGLFREDALDDGWKSRRQAWREQLDAVSEPVEVATLAVELEGQISASALAWRWLVARYAWRARAEDASTIADVSDLLWDLNEALTLWDSEEARTSGCSPPGYSGPFGWLPATAAPSSVRGTWLVGTVALHHVGRDDGAGHQVVADSRGGATQAPDERPGRQWRDSQRRFGTTLREAQVLARGSADADGELVCEPNGAYSVQCCRCIQGE